MNKKDQILICGGGEIASAMAIKLFRSGLNPVIYVAENEVFLRHNLCLGDAIYQNQKIVEDITATTIPENLLNIENNNSYPEKINSVLQHIIKDRKIPIVHQISFAEAIEIADPQIIINTLAETLEAVDFDNTSIIIGCYPYHFPGKNCNFAIETRLNYQLGEIYTPETQNIPDDRDEIIFFKNPFDVCTTPIEGVWVTYKSIGEKIKYNEPLGKMDEIEIKSPYDGQIWGIVHSGKFYAAKTPIAKIYTGLPSENYRYFSFQENAIAGAGLESAMRILK
jgi:xanthine dehydrogenase accessory factor